MSKYDLDKGKSILSFLNTKTLTKIVRINSPADLKHFRMFEFINATIIDRTENDVVLKIKDSIKDPLFFPEDHVVINYSHNKELYILSGVISYIYGIDPLTVSISVSGIEKFKDLRKHQRYYVSLTSTIKVSGFVSTIFAVVKNISSGGIKVYCKDVLNYDDIIDIEVILDRTNKLNFNGKIVRKSKIKDYYEYGIEIIGLSESNMQCLYHYMKWLNSDYV
ncbi:PilZ domain-containing protein [Herbivorax sp. ANBcel31]|uniref:PilZ domain-containing protein n=1 Tax=Herbivorax sp. ANBcel31 TaxID=3069754 RepID=UPI0027B525CC|nr:PilZ domain-containing protein [Herbivorax sp. ANBcel31]MDQ2085988.1 PilZ domain-containing protein [Herbivorax sp. ANBcel31]